MPDSTYRWDDLPRKYAMASHGHMVPHPKGVKARCGGPGICAVCNLEEAYLQLLGNYRRVTREQINA